MNPSEILEQIESLQGQLKQAAMQFVADVEAMADMDPNFFTDVISRLSDLARSKGYAPLRLIKCRGSQKPRTATGAQRGRKAKAAELAGHD